MAAPLLLAGCAGLAQVPTRRWASYGTAKVSTLLDVLLLKPRAVSQSVAQPADHRALMRGGWPAHSVAAAFFGLSLPSPGCRRVVDLTPRSSSGADVEDALVTARVRDAVPGRENA